MVRDKSQTAGINPGDPSAEAALVKLRQFQMKARKPVAPEPSEEWWTRDFFKNSDVSRREREAAFLEIRERRAPGWYYKAVGREAAYCLDKFVEQLPEKFTPAAQDKAEARERILRDHVLETIETAIREYNAALRTEETPREAWQPHGEEKDAARGMAIAPYYEHVLGLIESGRLRIPEENLPEQHSKEYRRNYVTSTLERLEPTYRLRFLLDVKAFLETTS